MSRSVKQARGAGGTPKPEGGEATGFPDITQKDSAANIAGDVTKFNTDDYQPAPFPTKD